MTTIDEVILKLDSIVEKCKNENLKAGYFAVLYRLVTIQVKKGMEQGEFEDNPRMEKLDVNFASRYIEAFEAYYSKQPTTQSWKEAFDAVDHSNCILLQHLLLGINAHINLDLGIAVAETSPGSALETIHKDFNKINDILASMVAGVKARISKVSFLFGWIIHLARKKDEILLNFGIDIAREGAWAFAGTYNIAADKSGSIRERDVKIAVIADGMIHTGRWLSFLLKIIRWGECRPVKKIMEILETTNA